MYNNGRGVPQDYATALIWYRKAADQGNARAESNLGVMYHSGLGVPRDDAVAAIWYRKAADQDYARAQSDLRKAADRGNAAAQFNLGVVYANGQGVARDDREAARLYKLAADQGNEWAQCSLGVFYEQGRGGLPKDDREAARLYKLAADQGNPQAQKIIGRMYELGRDVGQDLAQAPKLHQLAANKVGSPLSIKKVALDLKMWASCPHGVLAARSPKISFSNHNGWCCLRVLCDCGTLYKRRNRICCSRSNRIDRPERSCADYVR